MPLPTSNVFDALRLIQLAARAGGVSFAEIKQTLFMDRARVIWYVEALNQIELNPVGPDDYIEFTITDDRIEVLNHLHLANPINLTERDVIALTLALEWGEDQAIISGDAAATLKSKIQKTQLRSGAPVIINGVEVIAADDQPGREFLSCLSEAIASHRMVCITYFSKRNGDTTKRLIAPGRLYFREGLWYLRAYQATDNGQSAGWRSFRLDRVRDCQVLSDDFDPSALPDREQADQLFLFQDKDLTATRTRFAPKAAKYVRELAPSSAIEELPDGSILVNREVVGFPFYRSYVLQFGPEAEAVEPLEFRDAIRDHLKSFLQHLDPM